LGIGFPYRVTDPTPVPNHFPSGVYSRLRKDCAFSFSFSFPPQRIFFFLYLGTPRPCTRGLVQIRSYIVYNVFLFAGCGLPPRSFSFFPRASSWLFPAAWSCFLSKRLLPLLRFFSPPEISFHRLCFILFAHSNHTPKAANSFFRFLAGCCCFLSFIVPFPPPFSGIFRSYNFVRWVFSFFFLPRCSFYNPHFSEAFLLLYFTPFPSPAGIDDVFLEITTDSLCPESISPAPDNPLA